LILIVLIVLSSLIILNIYAESMKSVSQFSTYVWSHCRL